ncbi:phosphotransferase [Motilimonas eburnea]|uniref:phosphotransferase n=1 Tax=Motilimonas eburnea TaxID=1737488 RepID=UPI001E354096|nr:phosphotransferase [Motilimonas eburnea]MCE2573451.1 phosphotransferase [Motilimonas eburnea]
MTKTVSIAPSAMKGGEIQAKHVRQIKRIIFELGGDDRTEITRLLPLSQGISHASFRLLLRWENGQCHDWVVRLMGEQSEPTWLRLGVEPRLLAYLSRHGITAPVVASDVYGHWLITEFIAGKHPLEYLNGQMGNAWLDDLACRFKGLDQLSLPSELMAQLPRLDLVVRCRQLFDGILVFPDTISRNTLSAMLDYFAQLDLSHVSAQSLCHGDLHQGNLLFTPRGVKLLDWEYASLGSRLIDVAAISQDLGLSQQQIDYLLQQAGYQDWRDELAHYALGYRLIELLWYLQTCNINLLCPSQLETKWQQLLACWLQSQNT